MTATVTARLMYQDGEPVIDQHTGEPLVIKNMILSETVRIPHVCEGRIRHVVFDRVLVEFGEAWYRARGCE